jgi:uncharacterized protein YbbK (DUF523 family)
MTHLPRVGISQCLLGEEVRYDGGHKRDQNVLGFLDDYFNWVPVCPEVDVGMGVPREPVQLVEGVAAAQMVVVRMVGLNSGRDWTDAMRAYSAHRSDALAAEDLAGFIFKENSPSCGLAGVDIRDQRGAVKRAGVGLFAEALRERLPDLPVQEEGCLTNSRAREDFVRRVYSYWRRLNHGVVAL